MMPRASSSISPLLMALALAGCGGTTLTVDAGTGGVAPPGTGGAAGDNTGSGGATGSGGSAGDGGMCAVPDCAPNCPYGLKKNASGCPTCECKPPPMCGPVCDIFCQYGNVKDANGCPLCKCNPPPTPPTSCDVKKCPMPAPGAPNFVCPDGKTIAGPACVTQVNDTCGWVFITCPPKCVQSMPCPVGAHWDPDLCKCVSPCKCAMGEVCVEQMGGPAVKNPPPSKCQPYDNMCFQASGDPCACLAKTEGACKPLNGDRICLCDNGIR